MEGFSGPTSQVPSKEVSQYREEHRTTSIDGRGMGRQSISDGPRFKGGSQMSIARMRPELFNNGLAVPVGDEYYYDLAPRKYRWHNNTFQVFYKGTWQNAYSIDWEFIEG
jgi:hypothetical protein